jgi:hypothetical protein
MGVEMQFSSFGRLRVMRRMVGRGKVIRQFVTGGGGVVKLIVGVGEGLVFLSDLLLGLERDREGVWYIRTGQAVRERA